VHFSDSVIDV